MMQKADSKKLIALFVFSGFWAIGYGLFAVAFAETVIVKRVIDGDTVILEDETRVRLIGIDAPEIENRAYARRGEPYGEDAKRILRQWVEGKSVELRDGPEAEDRYGRRLAYLYLPGDFFVNLKLIEEGAAEAYRRFPHPHQSIFVEAETKARDQKAGLWAVESRPRNWWERLWGIQP